jgi:hypothetical protein
MSFISTGAIEPVAASSERVGQPRKEGPQGPSTKRWGTLSHSRRNRVDTQTLRRRGFACRWGGKAPRLKTRATAISELRGCQRSALDSNVEAAS